MSRKEEDYERALKDKKIPILIHDDKWNKLFINADTTRAVQILESKLTKLVARNKKLSKDIAKAKDLKKKLMEEILVLVDEREHAKDDKLDKEIDTKKRLVSECSEKVDEWTSELFDVRNEVDKVNHDLMIASMDACYEWLVENGNNIAEIEEWIKQVRVELKKKMVRKQEMQDQCQELYGYMHDIFGSDVIDIFDLEYMKAGDFARKDKKSAENAETKE